MQNYYAKKQNITQKKDAPSASSVIDASSQSESLQRKADMANSTAQRVETPRPNNTGMPDNLKAGIESLSGFSMDDVRVHYNSSKPATVQALAYTQGTDIHVAPGQEKHLPHEAWHVAQQMAGRVSPTTNINGMPVNDNAALEHEADVMGEKAVQRVSEIDVSNKKINYDFGNTCQMLRVINAYTFFKGIKPLSDSDSRLQGKTDDEKKEIRQKERVWFLFDSTKRLRDKYKNRAWKLWCAFCTSGERADLEKLRPYAPKNYESGDWDKMEDEINGQIEKEDGFIGETMIPIVSKDENLVINAHGQQGTLFAGFTPNDFAVQLYNILPEGYEGEIYLAGCHTGERNHGRVNGTSYIELLYKELMSYRGNDKRLNPTMKGNKNTARSTDVGVFVKNGGNEEVSNGDDMLNNASDFSDGRYVRGKTSKLHIKAGGETW